HQYYHQFLEDKGIQPSMSRKGKNSPDNGYDGKLIKVKLKGLISVQYRTKSFV
ncbi:IS3 family transposase, partial [Streptococcus thermophilus]